MGHRGTGARDAMELKQGDWSDQTPVEPFAHRGQRDARPAKRHRVRGLVTRIRTFLQRAWPVVAILAGAVFIALIPIVLQAMGVDMSGGGG